MAEYWCGRTSPNSVLCVPRALFRDSHAPIRQPGVFIHNRRGDTESSRPMGSLRPSSGQEVSGMRSAESRLRPLRLSRYERRRPRWTMSVLAVLPTLVLMTPLAVSAGMARAATPTALVRASSVSKDRHFVGTLTVTEHLVWDFELPPVLRTGWLS